VKLFRDSEARILGFTELTINDNEQDTNERGYAQRSSAQGNLIPGGMLGSFYCEDIHTHVKFHCGTGLTMLQRKKVWDKPENYRGGLIKYKYQPRIGSNIPDPAIFMNFMEEEE
jgi:hypothetical protein